ncbi:MAG: hypothetical protein IPP19_16505 [Verrucomicrobia bacterium]|nr:hypothetical protein [Verrucomicrobiota bacterium]
MPMMPLDAVGLGRATLLCVHADWEVELLGRLSAVAHTRGLMAADLIPLALLNAFANGVDFHPREIEAFERKLGFVIPGRDWF